MTSNARAFVLGSAVVAVIFGLILFASLNGFEDSFPFAWASLALGGFLVAYTASSRKLLLATSLAIPASVGLALFNLAWDRFGLGSDFKGLSGSTGVLVFSLVICTPLAFAGGFLGALASRGMTPNKSLERTREG
jgi:hypothetical protein